MRSTRPVPLLLLLLVLLSTVGPATAQTDLAGRYEAALTFDDITPPCIDAGIQGSFSNWTMEVDMRDTSNVDITFFNLPTNGEDTVFNASLNSDLNAFADHENGWTITGQFAGTGTDVTFSGRVQWTQECPIDSSNTYRPVPQSFTVEARRVSGGEDTQASPSPPPTSPLPASVILAQDAMDQECPRYKTEGASSNCLNASRYFVDWSGAMGDDIFALNLAPNSDTEIEIQRLRSILAHAAELGGLLVGGPTALMPRFPTINGMLPVFAFFFTQGVSQAATGQLDALRVTVSRADELLGLALAGDTRHRLTT